MTAQKKAEIEFRRITINLVPQIILKDRELTPKKKLTLCKMLICQLLLAVDTKNFYPTDIPMLLEHKWSDEERETHLENVGFLKRMQDKLTFFTSELKMKHLSMDLENMVKSIVTFLEELNQLNLVSKDDNYQVNFSALRFKQEKKRCLVLVFKFNFLDLEKFRLIAKCCSVKIYLRFLNCSICIF